MRFLIFQKLNQHLKFLILTVWLLFIGLLVLLVFVLNWYNSNLKPVDRRQNSKQTFIVAKDTTWDNVAEQLQKKGLIKSARALRWHVRFNQIPPLQSGTFELSRSFYVSEIVEILSSGLPSANINVTILPERNLKQLRQDLIDQGFKAIDVDTALQIENYANHPLVRDIIPYGATLEGYIAPESFAVDQFNLKSAKDIISQSLDIFHSQLTPAIREAISRNFNSIHEAVTIASIVELEAKPQYRDQVAQVFIKRYKQGDKLGSDVTFFYVAIKENRPPQVDDPSPYNTRVHAGLPPGPISNVSLVSLQAVAFPASTDYYFFLIGDDGQMYFNKTHDEHLADRDRYCLEACKLPLTVED